MNHGSLFSGIGGFDLAAEWMGWNNLFHCEWNPFGQKILHHYWPNAEQFTDITKSNFTKYANRIDILTGGFPCQPYSAAGKRKGKEDERHLWPEMLRAIREIAPRFVVGENVRGLTNWNGGLVFDEVCTDLENLGYQVAPFLIPASAVNAPHQRERIWFVAYANGGTKGTPRESGSFEKNRSDHNNKPSQWGESTKFDTGCSEFLRNTTDTNSDGFNECNGNDEIDTSQRGINAFDDINSNDERGNATDTNASRYDKQHISTEPIKQESRSRLFNARGNFERFPTQSPICGRNDGLPTKLDGITFSKWRNESIKAYGNAIVPQVALQIFKAIEAFNEPCR
jgi:DNA (cytosine-5)-methyltransferase 1